MSKTALLVLDMQNELIGPAGKVGSEEFARVVEARGLIGKTQRLLDAICSRSPAFAPIWRSTARRVMPTTRDSW